MGGVCFYQRRRSTDHLALVVVLGSVAGADELVLGAIPRHDAAEVSAHGVDPVGGQRLVLLHHQVRGVTLHARRRTQTRGGREHQHNTAGMPACSCR